jgi:NADH-quinone oxidoreductase subunit G
MEIGKCRADRHGTPFDKWYNESNLVNCQPGWVSLPEVAAGLGHAMAYKGPKQIMEEVSNALPSFKGATYPAMGEHGVRLETAGVTA